ncbi:hypothetical protein PQX77_009427 [Marasmius sp. AFHP31]|nr:hypothetical protein PQX77_009427 [Marasmius sp. AFHP31]
MKPPSYDLHSLTFSCYHLRNIESLSYEKKDVHYATSVIDADEGTNDGNWVVIESLLEQAGISKDSHSKYLLLVHGDLSTKEKVEAIKKYRVIEKNEYNRLDFILIIPGLFHLKMALVDAIWRIHVQPKENQSEPLGVLECIHHLRPKSTGEFTNKNGPCFRSMHDVIHHLAWANILECWSERVKEKKGVASLKEWAQKEPTWEEIVELSECIGQKHLPCNDFPETRESNTRTRDYVFENTQLLNHHCLLYLELCRAMNHGDVGRILELFPYMIAIFSATGKHKYAAHMARFIANLKRVYPKRLRDTVLRNWLYNEKGQPDTFRAFDWLQERNNLYTKVVFAGEGVNRTKALVMKRSPLLGVYRSLQSTIEESFYLTHRTVRHSNPDMTKTIQKLRVHLAALKAHTFQADRTTSIKDSSRKWVVMDAVTKGFEKLQSRKDLYGTGGTNANSEDNEGTEEDDEIGEITGDDIGAE